MLIGSWWRLEWYIMYSRIISQISTIFGKIPRKFPEKFGNLVQISGIQSKFREFSQDFGNLKWIFQWILRSFQWFEHCSKHLNTTEFFNLLKFYGILVISTEILNLVYQPIRIVYRIEKTWMIFLGVTIHMWFYNRIYISLHSVYVFTC